MSKEYMIKDDIVKCRECNSRKLELDETRGELTCEDCGLVLESNIVDQGQEWRYYGASDSKSSDPTRVGRPTNNKFQNSKRMLSSFKSLFINNIEIF